MKAFCRVERGEIKKMIISDEEFEQLKKELEADEGRRKKAYKDSKGNWTIGIGHFLRYEVSDWTDEDIDKGFKADILSAINDLNLRLPWWTSLDRVRQRALINLCFNMGITGLLSFQNMLYFLKSKSYEKAADHLKLSQWFRDVQKDRSSRIVKQIREGI